MCPQVSKFLSRRNWLICIGIAIALLLAVGIYFLVKKPACRIDENTKSAEDYVKLFGNEFIDDISKKYLAMVRKNYPNEKKFYESILPDLPANDFRRSEIQQILQKLNANFGKDNPTENITARVELIKLSKDLNAKFYNLSNSYSPILNADGFNKIREKHEFHKLEKSKNEELFQTVKAINENWRPMYKCIPNQYSKKYPEFGTIEKQLKEILTSDADKTTFKIYSLLERIDALFKNEIKVSQFDLGSASSPVQAEKGPQFSSPRGAQVIPPVLTTFPIPTQNGLANAYNSGVQPYINSGLQAINNATKQIKNSTMAHINTATGKLNGM